MLAAPVAAQHTWVVDLVAGPGVDFTDIPPAVAAAAPGDRIEVRGTTAAVPTYSSFVIDKELDVEATQRAAVYFFRVENLPTGAVARVAGFRCEPRPSSALPDDIVLVRNCLGSVLLSSLNVTTRTGDFRPGFVVRDSTTVAIQGCITRGRSAGLTGGGPALVLARSGVSITFSILTGGNGGGTASNAAGYDGGNGLEVTGGSIYAATTTIVGGDGGYGWAHVGAGGYGTVIAAGTASDVTLSACTIAQGNGAGAFDAVHGSARVTQDCVVTGPLGGGATLVPPLPQLMSTPSIAVGGTAVVTMQSNVGAAYVLGFDLRHDHRTLAGVDEPLLLPPSLVVGSIGLFTAPQAAWSLLIPNSPLLAEREVFFQAGMTMASGGIALTPLAATRMR